MKTLLTLINEYREEPSETLEKIIWKFILDKGNGHYFANINAYNDENDWIKYGENLRLKKIQAGVFAASEVVRNTFGGYFCLLHIVNLSEYSELQIEEYKDNLIKKDMESTIKNLDNAVKEFGLVDKKMIYK